MIANVPSPDVVGLNVVPLTPVPLYVPPVGDPPVNTIEDEFAHIGLKDASVTATPDVTDIVFVAVPTHPFASE